MMLNAIKDLSVSSHHRLVLRGNGTAHGRTYIYIYIYIYIRFRIKFDLESSVFAPNNLFATEIKKIRWTHGVKLDSN